MVLEEGNSKCEKGIREIVKLKNPKDNLSERLEQRELNDILEQIKKEQKPINMNLLKEYFRLAEPTKLTKKLFKTKYKNKNSEFVEKIKFKWSTLKDEKGKNAWKWKKNWKPDKILDIIKRIIKFNTNIQSGYGFKILTPDHMLNILPITLAQELILRNLRMKLDNYCILCRDQKNLQNNSIKVWSTWFQNVKNLYEYWK